MRSQFPLAFILLVGTGLCAGQTATRHTTTVHRAARPPACSSAPNLPSLPPGVPPVAGSSETAYALRYIDAKVGEGAAAEPGQFYQVHYTGWLASDGTKFDSSLDRGEPITFQQGSHRVIPGWDTAFAGMHVGGKRRLFIPYQLAYGESGQPPVIPPKSDLIFDIELVAQAPDPASFAPAAAPADANSPKPADTPDKPQR